MRNEVIETLAISVAQLVERERELEIQLDKIRAQKLEKIGRITAIASGREEVPEPLVVPDSKRQRVRDYIASRATESTFTMHDIATALSIDTNVISTYLGQFREQRLIEHLSRGVYRVLQFDRPKENASPLSGEAL